MKVLAIAGSPRKAGNSDILLDQAILGAQERGAEIEKVYVNKLRIQGCQACDACHREDKGSCIIQDDMQRYYPKLLAADVICIATPIYWWGPSAQLKLFIDRWYALGNSRTHFKGKTLALITVQGDKNLAISQPTIEMFRFTAKWLGMTYLKPLAVSASCKGEVRQNPMALAQALNLGQMMCKKQTS